MLESKLHSHHVDCLHSQALKLLELLYSLQYKVAGSIPDEVIGLTEMSTRN
jgi:hypothetical protein